MAIRMTWPDYLQRVVHYNGEYVRLSATEMALFLPLLLRRGQVISREDLIPMIWPNPDREPDWSLNALSVMQYRISKKLPGVIETVRALGLVIR